MQEVSLKDWTLFSKKANSSNYISADKKRLLKTTKGSSNDVNDDALIKEKELADKALSIGIPTPKVYDVVKIVEGGMGIIYEYIKDKKSVSRAISEDPDNIERYIKRYVDVEKKIHSKICDTKNFDSIEDRILSVIKNTDIYTSDEKEILLNFIGKVEKSNNCLHVDSHIGNVILSDSGDYAIDLGLMAYGNELYDVGVMYLFTHVYIDEDQLYRTFRLTPTTASKSWDIFAKHYFSVSTLDEKVKIDIKKYALLGFLSHAAILPVLDLQKIAKKALYREAFM